MDYWSHNPDAWPIRSTHHLTVDPDRPHPFLRGARNGYDGDGGYSCRACGGSERNTLHLEPIGGWPK